MQTLSTNLTVSMSDFKKNPSQVLRSAAGKPVAVLNHNKAQFYMVDPALFEALVEDYEDQQLSSLIASRLAQKDQAIEVSLDDL